MSILSVIRAPLLVQFNRVAFLAYAGLFGWALCRFGTFNSPKGLLVLTSYEFSSLLGLGYCFIRIRRARWILAVLGLVIPALWWA